MFSFILGLILCVLSASIFIYLRVNKNHMTGLISKIVASFTFVMFASFLALSNSTLSSYGRLACACVICGLVCGLIGDMLLDLKVSYPFQGNSYLKAGMTSFSCGHIFYIASLFLFVANISNLFVDHYIALISIFIGCILLTVAIYFISTKALKLKYDKLSFFVMFYAFLLLLTTSISILICVVNPQKPTFILPIGFALFFASDLVLSLQYFGTEENQNKKSLVVTNHVLYYMAQILIASFLFFA